MSLILIQLCVVLVAVLHFAGYMRRFVVRVCGFVNCVQYFDKTSLKCFFRGGKKTAIKDRGETEKNSSFAQCPISCAAMWTE